MRTVPLVLLAACLTVAALVASGWWAQTVAVFFGRRSPGWDAVDFGTLYSAGRLVATGHAHRIYDLDALTTVRVNDTTVLGAHRIAYLNPPFFAAVLAPLTQLPFDRAYQVWTGISLALLAATCWMVWRITSSLPKWQRALLITTFVISYPVTFALQLGQFSMILLASWTSAYVLLRRGHDRAAGVAMVPLLIKPELLIPVAAFLFWKKRHSVFVTLAPLTVVAVAASFAVVGPAAGLHYPMFILHNARNSANGTRTDFMFGWNGWVAAFLGSQQPLRTTLISLPLIATTLAGAAFAWRGPLDPRGSRFPQQWLVLTLTTVLADPNFFLQDIVIVFPAAFALLAECRDRVRTVMAAVLALGWVFCGLGLNPGVRWHFNLVATGMAVSMALLVWHAARSKEPADGEIVGAARSALAEVGGTARAA